MARALAAMAGRSPACSGWPGFSTATAGSWLTVSRSSPGSLPPAMRGLAPTRRRVGGYPSDSFTDALADRSPMQIPGPDRAQLLQLLSLQAVH